MKSKNIRKLALSALVAAPLMFGTKLVALPSAAAANMTVINGTAPTVDTSVAQKLKLSNLSNRTILEWKEFGSGAEMLATGETVEFAFASAGGALLNKVAHTVTDNAKKTSIAGSITANGSVYFLNPNGILIAPGAAGDKIVLTNGDFAASTIIEPDTFFLNNGKLGYLGTAKGDVTVNANGAVAVVDVGASGNITLAGKAIEAHGVYTGNLWIKGINGASVKVDGTISKNLDVSALEVGYAVELASSAGLTVGGDLTVISGGSVDLAKNVAGTSVAAGNVTVSTTKSDAAIASTNKLVAAAAGKSVTLTGGTVAGGNVTFKGDAETLHIKSAFNATVVDDNALKLGASTIKNDLNVTAVGLSMATASDKLTVANAATYNGGAAGNVTLSFATTTTDKPVVTGAATTGTVSLTSDGDLVLGVIAATTDLSVKTTGNLTQTGKVTATKATFETTKDIDLSLGAGNAISKIIVKGGAGSGDEARVNGFSLVNDADLIIEDTTAVTGVATIKTLNNHSVALGDTAADVLSFTKKLNLDLNGSGTITTVAERLTFDNIEIASGTGDLAIGVTDSTKNQVTVKNVAITSGGGDLALYTNSAIEFGKVDLGAGKLIVFTKSGGITSTDTITATGAQIEALAGSVTLTKDNAISGTIDLVGGANHGISSDFTLTNTVDTTLVNAKIGGTASFAVGANGLNVDGEFSNVKFTAESKTTTNKNISIVSSKALTLQASTYAGTTNGADDGTIVVKATDGDLTIGYGSKFITAEPTSFESTLGNITQSSGNLYLYGNVSFKAKSAITVADALNNFGGITALSTNGKDINIKESSAVLRVVAADTNLGNITFTNTLGDVNIGYTGKNGNIGADAGGLAGGLPKNVTLTSDLGSVIANLAETTAFTLDVTGSLAGTSKKDFLVKSGQVTDFNLGNITSTGKFSVESAKAVKQAASTRLTITGNASFKSGSDNIDVQNSGNAFGSVSATTDGTHAASIKQSGNLVIASATVKDLTLTAESGTITDETTGNSGNDKVVSTGTTTLKGSSITIDDTDGQYAIISLNSTGDASFKDTAGDLEIKGGAAASGGTSVSGKLTVVSAGNLTQNGGLTTNNLATFEATNAITLLGSNSFGSLILRSGGAVEVVENDGMDLVAGSLVNGNAILTSAADIKTSGTGGSTFKGTLRLNANGTITVNPIIVMDTLTVNSTATKDLSALSKSGNLNGKTPVNLGAGTYNAPKD